MVKFVLKHWVLTLLLSPLLILLFMLFDKQPMNLEGSYEMYLIMFLFSMLFSAPTYIFMFAIGYFMDREGRSIFQKKIILLSISILGILLSFQYFLPGSTYYFISAYIIISILITCILPVSNKTLANKRNA
jgi:MFS family permease